MNSGYFMSSAYVALFLRGVQLPVDALLTGTLITEDWLAANDYVAAEQVARLFHNIEQSSAPRDWTVKVGVQLNISTHGPLGFAALSAPTLGDALTVMQNYHAVRVTSLAASMKVEGKVCRFVLTDLTGDEFYAQVSAEAVLKVIQSLVETIIGHPCGAVAEIAFTHSAPKHADLLQEQYGLPCRFDAGYTGFQLPSSWLDIRSPLYDQGTYRTNVAKCREIIARHSTTQNTEEKVRAILSNHFDNVLEPSFTQSISLPSLTLISEQLNVTPRTLIRHLALTNCSYKQLVEQTKSNCAKELLQRANLSVADIAYLLGYNDVANFSRAFKRWTNTTPAQWRRS
jgi:AraC-like DNA-binding protein